MVGKARGRPNVERMKKTSAQLVPDEFMYYRYGWGDPMIHDPQYMTNHAYFREMMIRKHQSEDFWISQEIEQISNDTQKITFRYNARPQPKLPRRTRVEQLRMSKGLVYTEPERKKSWVTRWFGWS